MRTPRHHVGVTSIRVNHRIHAREIRLINVDGNQIGIMRPQKALSIAQQQGLDLVEVVPNADVPICRLMDYGKYKDEQSKLAPKSA